MFSFSGCGSRKSQKCCRGYRKNKGARNFTDRFFGLSGTKIFCFKSKINTKEFWNWKDFLKAGEHQKAQQTSYHENELSVIVYTSGTTGTPKGVMLSNDSLNAVAWQYEKSGMKFTRGETFLTFMPPFCQLGELKCASSVEVLD